MVNDVNKAISNKFSINVINLKTAGTNRSAATFHNIFSQEPAGCLTDQQVSFPGVSRRHFDQN